MSSYVFFMKTCQEEHRRSPWMLLSTSPVLSEVLRETGTMCTGEKQKMKKRQRQTRCIRKENQKPVFPPQKREDKKKFKDPNALKRPPQPFFLSCSEHCPQIKASTSWCFHCRCWKEAGRDTAQHGHG